MAQKLVVVVIHGIGNQEKPDPTATSSLSFSKPLHSRVRKEIGRDRFDQNVAWHEIFWADIMHRQMSHYLTNSKGKFSRGPSRKFVMNNLSDAAAYRRTADRNNKTYRRIHRRVADSFKQIEEQHGGDVQLVLLAHSLGGHILSNHIHDMQKLPDPAAHLYFPTAFCQFKTLRRFYTFGCNIPLFTIVYEPEFIYTINFPGSNPDDLKGWWQNYYDKQDVLGFPLAPLGGGYKTLADRGELKEKRINAGYPWEDWTPLSHNAYWRDADFYRDLAKYISVQI